MTLPDEEGITSSSISKLLRTSTVREQEEGVKPTGTMRMAQESREKGAK